MLSRILERLCIILLSVKTMMANKLKHKDVDMLDMLAYYFNKLIKTYEKKNDESFHGFVQVHHVNLGKYKQDPQLQCEDTGIVMQGPVARNTLSFLIIYRKRYPDVPIVYSTWENEPIDESFQLTCRENHIDLLLNPLPSKNEAKCKYQMVSSWKGLAYLKKNYGIKHVLKTRSDQFIARYDFLNFFRDNLVLFPAATSKLSERIIFLGDWNTYKWVPFLLSDFLVFGTMDDLSRMYGLTDFQARNKHDLWENIKQGGLELERKCTNPSALKRWNRICAQSDTTEMFIGRMFYEKAIGNIDYDRYLQTYWEFLKNDAIIIDASQLMLYWPKYGHQIHNCYERRGALDHASWLDLYLHYDGKIAGF